MENIQTFILESERLILKPISLEYKREIFQEFTSEITQFMYPKPPENISETETFIKLTLLQMQKGTELGFVILKKDSLEFLGLCGIHNIQTNTPALGIWLKKSAHGNGFGKEAIRLLKDWAYENLEYDYLSYPVDKRNIASRKIPESLGGKVFREYQHFNLSGNLLDIVEYRIYKR